MTAVPTMGGEVLGPETTRLGRTVLSHSSDMSIDAALRRLQVGGTTVNDHRSYSATNHGISGAIVQGDHTATTTTLSSITQQQRDDGRQLVDDLLSSAEITSNEAIVERLEAVRHELALDEPDKGALAEKVGAFALSVATHAPAAVESVQRLSQLLGLG